MENMENGELPLRKHGQLEAGISPAQEDLAEYSPAPHGTPDTEFAIAGTQEFVTTPIEGCGVLQLQDQGREVFINAVLNPLAPNETARAAAERYTQDLKY